MSNLKLSDFNVGQEAYIKKTRNQARHIKDTKDLIIKTKIESIGRKYIITEYSSNIKFKETDTSHEGLIEHTDYCIDYELFPNEQMILDGFEKENLLSFIRSEFYYMQYEDKFSLEQLRRIVNVIKEGVVND